jgi:hypothetical protein
MDASQSSYATAYEMDYTGQKFYFYTCVGTPLHFIRIRDVWDPYATV